MIPSSVIRKLKETIDPLSYYQKYVELKKAGKLYEGRCPFHADTAPSFKVYPADGGWHCFGSCSEGGDVIAFHQKKFRLSFPDAARDLAQQYGVDIEEENAEEKRIRYLCGIISEAADIYHQALLRAPSAGAEEARRYSASRGVDRVVAAKFGIGYAPDAGQMYKVLHGKYSDADLTAAGIISQANNGHTTDFFTKRLIFPIRTDTGTVVGFGGRSLNGSKAKYINSPQSAIFNKSNLLFGLDVAKMVITQQDNFIIVVEGYTDVIAAIGKGYPAVAQMGTALTQAQVNLLSRFTDRIVLATDGDKAGLKVIKSVAENITPPPRKYIYVAFMPEGKDPDTLIRTDIYGWMTAIEDRVPLFEAYFDIVRSEADPTKAAGKTEIVTRIAPVLARMDAIDRDHYVQMVARLLSVRQESIRQAIPAAKTEATPAEKEEEGQVAITAEDYLLAIVMCKHTHMFNALLDDDLRNPINRETFIAWKAGELIEEKHKPHVTYLYELLEIMPPVADEGAGEANVEVLELLRRLRRKRQASTATRQTEMDLWAENE